MQAERTSLDEIHALLLEIRQVRAEIEAQATRMDELFERIDGRMKHLDAVGKRVNAEPPSDVG